jgi:hypothetical protein
MHVGEQVGVQAVVAAPVVAAHEERAEADPEDEADRGGDRPLGEARVGARFEIEDRAHAAEDLAQRIDVADRREEVGQRLDRHRAARRGETEVDEEQQADQLPRRAEHGEEGERPDRHRRRAEPAVGPEQEGMGRVHAEDRDGDEEDDRGEDAGQHRRHRPLGEERLPAADQGRPRHRQSRPDLVRGEAERPVEPGVDDRRADEAAHHQQQRDVEGAQAERRLRGQRPVLGGFDLDRVGERRPRGGAGAGAALGEELPPEALRDRRQRRGEHAGREAGALAARPLVGQEPDRRQAGPRRVHSWHADQIQRRIGEVGGDDEGRVGGAAVHPVFGRGHRLDVDRELLRDFRRAQQRPFEFGAEVHLDPPMLPPPVSRCTKETGSPSMWSTGSTAEPM